MGFLIIDEEKCKKDGICAWTCPGGIISMETENGYPAMVSWGESACTRCGHCVAVCPHGALRHEKIPLAGCPPINEDLLINEAQAVQFLRSRRSIRLYKDRPVEKAAIRELIEAARYAPTGGNTQLVEWQVLTDRAQIHEIARLAAEWLREALNTDSQLTLSAPYLPMIVKSWDSGKDSILRNAPVLIAASAPKIAMNGMVDLTLALSYLDLLAPAKGLGTCWAGLLQRALLSSPALKNAAGIPEDHPHHYPMMLGYPAVKYRLLAGRKPPKITFR
ncbi:MAG TPA: nitroreductase family protein [Syntrophorhabdaceae bacterium]|jgi:nitroreductase/NAD-dependent dihydropyrimidine dehydrogenase PreA subunit